MPQVSDRSKIKSEKILLLYFIVILGFIIFLGMMLRIAIKPRHMPSLYAKESSRASRGSIISVDGFHIATTKKLYKAIVNTRYIDPQKKELFIQLFSIYSGIDAKKVAKKLTRNGVVVLSYNVPQKEAQYLKRLAYELRRYGVFLERKNPKTGVKIIQGLSVIESGESRVYPYGKLLTPVIGYPHKVEDKGYTRNYGVKGLEKRFDVELSPRSDGFSRGKRDVNNYIILNKESWTKPQIDGLDIILNIPVALQLKMEQMCSWMKDELEAKEVSVAIMDSQNGDVLSIASSNRFLPKDIKRSDYPSLNTTAIEYSFEPGSVIKPLTFALLLDKNLINPYDIVRTYNGKFKMGRKIITDEHRYEWLSAEDVIVHSSNIGIAQLAQKLSGAEFYAGFKSFGLTKKSTPDLIYERRGSIPSAIKLENKIYKATASYGYGLRVNLMQLLRAYSAFNNDGKIVKPKIVKSFFDGTYNKTIEIPSEEPIRVIKSSTALRMKKILIKTVLKGTGRKTITPGVMIGGKTGTAHIVKKGEYVHSYNTSFLGFVNDKTHKYTMGVLVIEPQKNHFASQSAVPVFKKAVDILIDEGYIVPMDK